MPSTIVASSLAAAHEASSSGAEDSGDGGSECPQSFGQSLGCASSPGQGEGWDMVLLRGLPVSKCCDPEGLIPTALDQ